MALWKISTVLNSVKKEINKNIVGAARLGGGISAMVGGQYILSRGLYNRHPVRNVLASYAVGAAGGAAVGAALSMRNNKKKLSAKELKQRKEQRKEMAKKIAKGVAIGAAVAGTAYVAHKAVREINTEKHDLQNTLRKLDMNLQIEKDPIHALSSYDPRARDVAKSTPLAGRSVKKMSLGELKRTIDETKIAAQKQEIRARAERKNEEARRQIAREMMSNTPYKFTSADAKKWDTMFAKTSIDDLKKKNKNLFNASTDSILSGLPRGGRLSNMTMDDLRKLDLY